MNGQSPKPSGRKIHESILPKVASILRLISATIPKRPSVKPKFERNQITMEHSRMTVPAFLIKLQLRSHMERRMLRSVGM